MNKTKNKKLFFRKFKWFIYISLFSILIILFYSNFIINRKTNSFVFDDVNKIKKNKVALLLGTSKKLKSGQQNQYFQNRIIAAVELFNADKIEYIVISGDNSEKYYNEPLDMKNELLKRGVTENKIYLDYAGFRTYDSVIRMYKIFGQKEFTIISQEFHNRRAIYIANKMNLDAVGYNAKDVSKYYGFKTRVREYFARVKVIIDLIIKKEPKYLGEQILIK